MALCGLSAVLVMGSVHVRPEQSSSARLSALARTGSKVCTNCGDVEEDGLIAAERDLVGPVPVRRCTNPISDGTRGRGFHEAEGRVP